MHCSYPNLRVPLIVFEGADGVGKGTQLKMAHEYLANQFGFENVLVTADPGGTPLGRSLRKIIFEDPETNTKALAPNVVDLIFLASHIQNWRTKVEPGLLDGKIVLSDRWWYSQDVYSSLRVVDPSVLHAYMKMHGPNADLMIYFHSEDVEESLRRANERPELHQQGKAWNDLNSQLNVQKTYFSMFSGLSEFFPINVTGKTPDEVFEFTRQGIIGALKDKDLL